MGEKINNVGAMLNNPKQRNIYMVGVAIAILAVASGAYYATRKVDNVGPGAAQVASVPQVNAVPGASESVRYNEMVNQDNIKEANKAVDLGKTYVPSPVNLNSFNTESPIDALDKQNKAQKIKDDQEIADKEAEQKLLQPVVAPIIQAPIVQAPVIQAPIVQRVEPVAKKYASDEDYQLISTLSSAWKIKDAKHEFNYDREQNNNATGSQSILTSNSNQQAQQTSAVNKGKLLARAGTIYSAILETGINSDEPSPVLAKIVAGDLKGTRLIGKMVTSGEKVVVQFGTASIPSLATSIKLNSVAIDPSSSRTGLATDVDRHYFLRYGVLLGAAFLGGYADALATQNTTSSVTPDGNIISTKGPMTAQEINKQALGGVGKELANQTRSTVQNLKSTITVDAGTAIGILIMDDLYSNAE